MVFQSKVKVRYSRAKIRRGIPELREGKVFKSKVKVRYSITK